MAGALFAKVRPVLHAAVAKPCRSAARSTCTPTRDQGLGPCGLKLLNIAFVGSWLPLRSSAVM
jgi:hypothetical protein